MTTFAEELEGAAACTEGVDWVIEWVERRKRLGIDFTENDFWKTCPRGDWLWWLLLDAFAIGEYGLGGPQYNTLYPSLSTAMFMPPSYPTPSDEDLAGLADRIRKIFPEWPL